LLFLQKRFRIFDSLMENFSIMGSVNSLAFSGHAFTHAQHLMHLSPSQSNFSSIAPTGHASMHFPHPMHLSVATDCIKGILGAGLFGISPGKASAFKPSFHSSPPAILPMTFFPKALAMQYRLHWACQWLWAICCLRTSVLL